VQLVGWLDSRVVSVLDSGAEGPGFKSHPRRCRVTVLGKLFTPIVLAPLVAARLALDLLTSLKFSVGLSLEFDYDFCTVRCCWSAAYGVVSSLLFHRRLLVQNAFYLQICNGAQFMRDLVGHATHLSAYTRVPGINTT